MFTCEALLSLTPCQTWTHLLGKTVTERLPTFLNRNGPQGPRIPKLNTNTGPANSQLGMLAKWIQQTVPVQAALKCPGQQAGPTPAVLQGLQQRARANHWTAAEGRHRSFLGFSDPMLVDVL